ncbi:MAG: hypothetical protein B7Z80_10610 [Rhodospirillales bacterium 20-64-7]|nr:MAG: hypothetical protein B7Z80_10610 [Rhodospirillales bacterium 20-64-7]HQT76606.1 hypothetical protein [Rhodopila sp.]
MLLAIDVPVIRLLTNNPDKAEQVARYGIKVARIKNTAVNWSPHDRHYLLSKRAQAGHRLAAD